MRVCVCVHACVCVCNLKLIVTQDTSQNLKGTKVGTKVSNGNCWLGR